MIKIFKFVFKIFKIIKFLLFSRGNYFRNYLLNEDNFNKLYQLSKSNNFDKINFLENIDNLNESLLQYHNVGHLNEQLVREKIISQIIEQYQPKKILETGTFLGASTEYFSKFGHKVISIESSDLYYLFSLTRLRNYDNIQLIHGDSSDNLIKYVENEEYLFVYIDAHWNDNVPLEKELKILFKNKNFIICIDDFKVEDKDQWSYDKYENIELSLDQFPIIFTKSIYFPSYDIREETGAKKGCIFIASGSKAIEVLNNVEGIAYYNKKNYS